MLLSNKPKLSKIIMSKRNPFPPPLAIWTVAGLCWALVLWIQVPRAGSFVVVTSPTITNRVEASSPHRSQVTRLRSAADDAVSNNNDSSGFFWNFRGHSCYAEILPPSVAKKKKPTVLLIHGFACSTVYWRETKEYLTREGYTVHVVDLLGQGKSSKPGRSENIVYSIDLWAQMVDEYAAEHLSSSEVVLVGNSLGSLVALSVTTGDCYANDEEKDSAYLSSRVQGLCLFNCGVGLNTKNIVKTASSPLARTLFEALFVVLDFLIFGNKPLLTYVIDKQVSKELLSEALTALYQYAEDGKVDDELVDSFLDPVRNDKTEAVVDVLSQIYTNDPGRTPMELHDRYSLPPIHLIWGEQDTVTPIAGDVGQFYIELAATPDSNVSLEMIPNAGHVLFDERPDCNQGLIEWLERTF